jgi:hypothetical protein
VLNLPIDYPRVLNILNANLEELEELDRLLEPQRGEKLEELEVEVEVSGPDGKLSMYAQMIWAAYNTAYSAVRSVVDAEHPGWSLEQQHHEVASILEPRIRGLIKPPYSLEQGRRIGEKLAQEWGGE